MTYRGVKHSGRALQPSQRGLEQIIIHQRCLANDDGELSNVVSDGRTRLMCTYAVDEGQQDSLREPFSGMTMSGFDYASSRNWRGSYDPRTARYVSSHTSVGGAEGGVYGGIGC